MIVRLTGSLALTLVIGACGSGLDPPLAVESTEPMQVLYRGTRCPATQPGIRVFRDAATWAEWQGKRQQLFFSASNEPEDAPADLDFGHFSVIVISMGQKPTPGYAVDVSEGSVTLQGKTLTISTVWHNPPEGAILAQVITSRAITMSQTSVRSAPNSALVAITQNTS